MQEQIENVLQEMREVMDSGGGESSIGDNLLQHIFTRVTDEGLIVESGTPDEIFDNPQHERTKAFFDKIL